MKRDANLLSEVECYVAGMPHLCWYGLSENWLLKECGHRHWMAIAKHQGQVYPEFVDTQGGKVYAAFTFIRIDSARLHKIQEHSRFVIESCHCEVGRTQDYSRHAVFTEGSGVAYVEMLSAYVSRETKGDNQSVVRATLERIGHGVTPSALASEAETFLQHARTRRKAATLPDTEQAVAQRLDSKFTPCPNGDFNGAALLYFSSIQSIVDRTEWEHRRHLRLQTDSNFELRREMVFKGNLNLGDAMHTQMRVQRLDDGQLSHQCSLYRQSDGALVAKVSTEKNGRFI